MGWGGGGNGRGGGEVQGGEGVGNKNWGRRGEIKSLNCKQSNQTRQNGGPGFNLGTRSGAKRSLGVHICQEVGGGGMGGGTGGRGRKE